MTAKKPLPPCKTTDPHPFGSGDKTRPCPQCGGGYYESAGHWRKA